MMYRTRTPTGDGYINVQLPTKPYRLFVSGGFDSALLLYLFCKQAQAQELSTVYVAVVDRGLASVDFAYKVCAWATVKTGILVNIEVLTIAEDLEHHRQVNEPASRLHAQNIITVSADTQNPPNVELPGVAPRRIAANSHYDNWHFPFSGVDKSHTVWLAQRLDILDDISAITHTCTETAGLRCGQCWQCSERAWAFNLLGYTDIGQY